jgi:hypothetical protein
MHSVVSSKLLSRKHLHRHSSSFRCVLAVAFPARAFLRLISRFSVNAFLWLVIQWMHPYSESLSDSIATPRPELSYVTNLCVFPYCRLQRRIAFTHKNRSTTKRYRMFVVLLARESSRVTYNMEVDMYAFTSFHTQKVKLRSVLGKTIQETMHTYKDEYNTHNTTWHRASPSLLQPCETWECWERSTSRCCCAFRAIWVSF